MLIPAPTPAHNISLNETQMYLICDGFLEFIIIAHPSVANRFVGLGASVGRHGQCGVVVVIECDGVAQSQLLVLIGLCLSVCAGPGASVHLGKRHLELMLARWTRHAEE